MSWSYRITILVLSFVCFMTALVVAAIRQDFDLVAEDYYGKELKFQNQIDKRNNYLTARHDIRCEQSDVHVLIRFPFLEAGQTITGEVVLFRPSDAKRDVKQAILLEDGIQRIRKDQLISGLYRIQIDYKVAGKSYYVEQDLMVY